MGVLLITQNRKFETHAATSQHVHHLHVLRERFCNGSALQAALYGPPIVCTHDFQAERRWPKYSRAVVDLGDPQRHVGQAVNGWGRTAGMLSLPEDLVAIHRPVLASRDFDMDIAEWLGLDLEFHTAITRAAHNPILELAMTSVHLIRPVTNRIFVDRLLDRRSGTEQHEQMYEAIATADPVKSRAAFTAHIGYLDSVRSEVLRDLNADDVRISDIPDQ